MCRSRYGGYWYQEKTALLTSCVTLIKKGSDKDRKGITPSQSTAGKDILWAGFNYSIPEDSEI